MYIAVYVSHPQCTQTHVTVLAALTRQINLLYTLAASNGKRNVTLWRPSVCLTVPFFLTLTGRAAHTQRDSPGGSTRRGQRSFPSEYYEDEHSC